MLSPIQEPKWKSWSTIPPEGLRSLAALLVLREKIIGPLLAASTQPEPTAKPAHPTPIDHHYENLRTGMRSLFTELGIAA